MIWNGDKKEFLQAVAEGSVEGHFPFTSLGERPTIGATVQGEDLWGGVATQLPIPASVGEQMTIVSSSTADNGATATGILTLRIEYIDGNGLEKTEDFTVNGQTPVDSDATNIKFVNDMYMLTVGSNGVAEGIIIIYKKGSAATIYNRIAVGGNKSLVSNRMVPAGKTLYITNWTCSESKTKETSFRLRANCNPAGTEIVGGFLFKRNILIKETSLTEEIKPSVKVCSGAIVKVSAWATGAGGSGAADFSGYLKVE